MRNGEIPRDWHVQTLPSSQFTASPNKGSQEDGDVKGPSLKDSGESLPGRVEQY